MSDDRTEQYRRDQLGCELRAKVEVVRENGWGDYESEWDTVTVLGVRAVMNEPGAEDAAVASWAPILWGEAGAPRDAQLDYDLTRRWFRDVAGPVRIIEAVPVADARLVWFRMSDDATAEVRTGPLVTVGELMARLVHIPLDTPLLTDGYEGGLTTISAVTVREVQELERDADQATYLGEFEAVQEAHRQAEMSPDDPEIAIGGIAPPRLVGGPVHAVVLRRKGR